MALLMSYRGWWIIILSVATGTATGVLALYRLIHTGLGQQNSPETITENIPVARTITCLGRITPQGGVTRLFATVPLEGGRVEQVFVKKGDLVKAGQVIAVLQSREHQLTALKRTQSMVKIAKARLEQVKAGAKTGAIKARLKSIERLKAELKGQSVAQQAKIASLQASLQGEKQAQQSTIERFKAQFNNAQNECKRYQKLYQDGAVSTSLYDSKCLEEETFREQLKEAEANLIKTITTLSGEIKEAQATLTRTVVTLQKQIIEAEANLEEISEVRPVDVQSAQAEVDNAIATVKQAEADLELTYVRTPINGRILEVNARAGEKIPDEGIVELSKTQPMEVIAEVYKTDIGQVRLGQQVIITSDTFPGKLKGKITQIGLEVKRQNIFSTLPGSNVDRKIVEVNISLDPEDNQQIVGLINLQVEVAIQIDHLSRK